MAATPARRRLAAEKEREEQLQAQLELAQEFESEQRGRKQRARAAAAVQARARGAMARSQQDGRGAATGSGPTSGAISVAISEEDAALAAQFEADEAARRVQRRAATAVQAGLRGQQGRMAAQAVAEERELRALAEDFVRDQVQPRWGPALRPSARALLQRQRACMPGAKHRRLPLSPDHRRF